MLRETAALERTFRHFSRRRIVYVMIVEARSKTIRRGAWHDSERRWSCPARATLEKEYRLEIALNGDGFIKGGYRTLSTRGQEDGSQVEVSCPST